MLKKMVAVLGAALCLTMGLTALASAQDYKKFQFGLKGVYVLPDDNLNNTLGGARIDADVTPGIDLAYFFTKNVSAELFAAATHHDIRLGGETIGSTWLLPPTLTVKFHPLAGQKISPYIGGGMNFTMPFNSRVDSSISSKLNIHNSVNWVAQGGVDFNVAENIFFNIDYKYVNIDTQFALGDGPAHLGGMYDLEINPHLFAAGVGVRF
ncbi:outer membrane beta-barrel protein [Geomonas sp. RF6]|uniref:OmpW/AlkL family protein n=1 Tax=Geomonas sp. RF6 TaxID=2897342 RepID=UPI001E5F8434|nr:OmpW family outer membrane protein [Geomonas sp. RF6]UFS70758.1 outer membrane beta-barrel protein [Geomonas sp. RF6]